MSADSFVVLGVNCATGYLQPLAQVRGEQTPRAFVVAEVTLFNGQVLWKEQKGSCCHLSFFLGFSHTLPWLSFSPPWLFLTHCLQSCAAVVLPSFWCRFPSCAPEEQGKACGEVAALLWSLGHVRSRWEADREFSLSYVAVWKDLFQLLWWSSAQARGLYHSNLISPNRA